jgi:hypothetical protein
MTKPKLVTTPVKRLWQPVVTILIKSIMTEPARTDGKGKRSKIRLKFTKPEKHFTTLPRPVIIEETEEYVIKEWRCYTLLDFLHKHKISKYNSRDIYSKRQGLMKELFMMEKSLDVE